MSDSLRPHVLEHARLLCIPLSPRVCWNSCPLIQWWYLTILYSVIFFSFCLQSFPVCELALRIRWPKYWASASAIVLPVNIQGWFILGLTGLSKGLFQESTPSSQFEASILWNSAFFMVQLTSVHDYWKNYSFDSMDICWQSDVSSS